MESDLASFPQEQTNELLYQFLERKHIVVYHRCFECTLISFVQISSPSPVCDHVFKRLESYLTSVLAFLVESFFHFLGDHIPDCLHCGSWKFVLVWNVQSHADDVIGCNSLTLLPLQTDFENSHQGSLYLLALLLFMHYCWCIWHLGCNSPVSDHVHLESHHVAFWMCGAKWVMSSWMIILQISAVRQAQNFLLWHHESYWREVVKHAC